MTQLLKKSEFPNLSADPQKHLFDLGFPLYRFKDTSRHLKLIRQDQVLSRTNDFKPTTATLKRTLRSPARYIYLDVPELKNFNRKEFLNVLLEDVELSRQYEEMDPLIGNALIVTDYLDEFQLYLFSAGASLSNLVILTSKKSNQVNEMNIQDTIELSYPIRQIILSPLSTLFEKIFLVRTTSSIHLFKLNTNDLCLIHQWILPQKSITNDKIDYSMSIHVEPSPFYKYQYLFITNNGYYALIDGKQDKVLFENVDPISEEANYKSRWKSCGFGKTPFTIYIVSPESIKEFVIRNTEIASKILATPNDRIIAFKTSTHLLYCFITLDSIVVMNRMLIDDPIITWKHKMRDGPPTQIMMDQVSKNHWRIIAFSPHTSRYTMIYFRHVNNPLIDVKPTTKILEVYNFNLPIVKCEEIYNYTSRINIMGCSLHSLQKNAVFDLYRLFQDGSIYVHHLALTDQTTQLTFPTYQLSSTCKSFDTIMKQTQTSILPMREGKSEGLAEVCDIDMKHFNDYLNHQVVLGDKKPTHEFKINMAEKVRALKSTTTFLALFSDEDSEDEEDYEDYTLEGLTDFLEELQVHENIERARQVDNIPSIFSSKQPTNLTLHEKLVQAHEKEIQLASLMMRPLKEDGTFQYLNSIKFNSTTTTRALASLWTLDDTRYEQLMWIPVRTNRILEKETFPCLSIYKRKRQEDEEEPLLLVPPKPAASMQPDDEIFMPVVVASQPHIKRTQKSSSRSLPTVTEVVELSDDEEEDKITPQKLFQSITASQPSTSLSQLSTPPSLKRPATSSSFASTSTQPLPGAFASRKPATKKKITKKPKTSGFR